jgi:hypothetical protein
MYCLHLYLYKVDFYSIYWNKLGEHLTAIIFIIIIVIIIIIIIIIIIMNNCKICTCSNILSGLDQLSDTRVIHNNYFVNVNLYPRVRLYIYLKKCDVI